MKRPNQLIEEIVEEHAECRWMDASDLDRLLQGYTKEIVEFACEWIVLNIGHYVNGQGYVETHELERDFKQAMEKEL